MNANTTASRGAPRQLAILACVAAFAIAATAGAQTPTLDEVQEEGANKAQEAAASQQKIDGIVAGTQERLIQYRALLKQSENLEAYNEQLAMQIAGQRDLIERLERSITQVTLIERQTPPLALEMVEALTAFIELDLPFHMQERRERMLRIREGMTAADIDISERYRQIIEAYQIENEYGRKMSSYPDIVNIDGADTEVDVLQVGRIALVCQSRDAALSARWNPASKAWEVISDAAYRNAIRRGIRIAKKQVAIDILTLPIAAPEIAQ